MSNDFISTAEVKARNQADLLQLERSDDPREQAAGRGLRLVSEAYIQWLHGEQMRRTDRGVVLEASSAVLARLLTLTALSAANGQVSFVEPCFGMITANMIDHLERDLLEFTHAPAGRLS